MLSVDQYRPPLDFDRMIDRFIQQISSFVKKKKIKKPKPMGNSKQLD